MTFLQCVVIVTACHDSGAGRGVCVGRGLGTRRGLRRVLEAVPRRLRGLHEEVQVDVMAARVLVQT